MTATTQIHQIMTEMDDITNPAGKVMSLEDRIAQSYASANQEAHELKDYFIEAFSHPDLSNEKLAEIQAKLADYSIEMGMTSTFVRKTTAAIDTLLRS